MDKQFSETLRKQMKCANIKELELAESLSYDVTYINKWMNGKKLPSMRNVNLIIEKTSELFSKKTDIPANVFFDELKGAYAHDYRYMNLQSSSDLQLSLIMDMKMLYQLTLDIIHLVRHQKASMVTIDANFDLIQLYGSDFIYLIKDIKALGVNKISIKMAMDETIIENNSMQYASNILKIITGIDDMEVTMVARNKEAPSILTINDVFFLQVLWKSDSDMAAVFTLEKDLIQKFLYMNRIFANKPQKLLDPAKPVHLRNTNVQIASYSDKRMWLLSYEAPAMLFPDDIMDEFIANATDDDYTEYLKKLKMIFSKWTRFSEVDLVLFASVLNQYVSDGKVNVGNVPQQLTDIQVKDHIHYLSRIMKENPKFRIWLIRDAILSTDDIQYAASLFIDTQALYIETPQKDSSNHFHISMNPHMRSIFQKYFENLLNESYCQQLTAEELLKYI